MNRVEDGCGVFLPQDYFHLRPRSAPQSKNARSKATVRLGRFTCLPVAEQQPTAAEALEGLAEDSGIAIVPVRSLAPRELAQNLGLPQREADLARHRDFDELFFFVGTPGEEIVRFRQLARGKGCQLRQRGALWSLAIGASIPRCIRELTDLYDRALHAHARSVAVAVCHRNDQLASACDRAVLLTDTAGELLEKKKQRGRVMELPNRSSDRWERILGVVAAQPQTRWKQSV